MSTACISLKTSPAVQNGSRPPSRLGFTKAVEVLSNRLSLTQDEQSSVLRHLIEGGDLSQYGLINAVTRAAEDAKSYDRATELEMAGATVLDLKPTESRDVALAA